jgi:hypothetical protein
MGVGLGSDCLCLGGTKNREWPPTKTSLSILQSGDAGAWSSQAELACLTPPTRAVTPIGGLNRHAYSPSCARSAAATAQDAADRSSSTPTRVPLQPLSPARGPPAEEEASPLIGFGSTIRHESLMARRTEPVGSGSIPARRWDESMPVWTPHHSGRHLLTGHCLDLTPLQDSPLSGRAPTAIRSQPSGRAAHLVAASGSTRSQVAAEVPLRHIRCHRRGRFKLAI